MCWKPGATQGEDFLLRSLGLLSAEMQGKIELILVGRPLDEEFSKKVLQQLHAIPHATYLGEVSQQQIMALMSSAEIFVLPSIDEVMPGTPRGNVSCTGPLLN